MVCNLSNTDIFVDIISGDSRKFYRNCYSGNIVVSFREILYQ